MKKWSCVSHRRDTSGVTRDLDRTSASAYLNSIRTGTYTSIHIHTYIQGDEEEWSGGKGGEGKGNRSTRVCTEYRYLRFTVSTNVDYTMGMPLC